MPHPSLCPSKPTPGAQFTGASRPLTSEFSQWEALAGRGCEERDVDYFFSTPHYCTVSDCGYSSIFIAPAWPAPSSASVPTGSRPQISNISSPGSSCPGGANSFPLSPGTCQCLGASIPREGSLHPSHTPGSMCFPLDPWLLQRFHTMPKVPQLENGAATI